MKDSDNKMPKVPVNALGSCTWAIKMPNGAYVYDPVSDGLCGFSVDLAHMWFDQDRAQHVADTTPWMVGSRAVRGRP